MSVKSLDVLVVSRESGGHINACIGISQILISAGHRVFFPVTHIWKGKLEKYGINELELQSDPRPQNFWSDLDFNAGATKDWPTVKKWSNIFTTVFPIYMSDAKRLDEQLEVIIKNIKPDLIVIDHVLTIPAVELSGIPWINSSSYNPLTITDDERTPPQHSGLPTDPRYSDQWKAFRNAMNEAFEPLTDDYNQWVVSRGLPPLKKYRCSTKKLV